MINLTKGQKVAITGMQFAKAGLGWDVNNYDSGKDFDLDATCFCLDASGKMSKDTDMIFYNNTVHPSGAVKHTGDNRNGEGSGDDESIFIDFTKIPDNIVKLAFVITIHEATERNQNFGQINNAYVRLLKLESADAQTGTEEIRFDLSEDYSTETSILAAEIYKKDGEWKFAAKGDGYKQGLAEFVRQYGGQC